MRYLILLLPLLLISCAKAPSTDKCKSEQVASGHYLNTNNLEIIFTDSCTHSTQALASVSMANGVASMEKYAPNALAIGHVKTTCTYIDNGSLVIFTCDDGSSPQVQIN